MNIHEDPLLPLNLLVITRGEGADGTDMGSETTMRKIGCVCGDTFPIQRILTQMEAELEIATTAILAHVELRLYSADQSTIVIQHVRDRPSYHSFKADQASSIVIQGGEFRLVSAATRQDATISGIRATEMFRASSEEFSSITGTAVEGCNLIQNEMGFSNLDIHTVAAKREREPSISREDINSESVEGTPTKKPRCKYPSIMIRISDGLLKFQ